MKFQQQLCLYEVSKIKLSNNEIFATFHLLQRIQIIAILAAMLLPALNKARDTAHSIRCVSNQKQWATLMTQYTGDFSGYYTLQYDATDPSGTWYYWNMTLCRQYGFGKAADNYSSAPLGICPADRSDVEKKGTANVSSYGIGYHFNYFKNGSYYISSYRNVRESMVKRPSYLILTIDSLKPPAFSPQPGTWAENIPQRRHRNMVNMSFADGHTETLRLRSFGLYSSAGNGWKRDDARWKQW